MSARLEARAETVKLARLLVVEPDELGFLADVSPAALRELREQMTDRLFDANSEANRRVGAAAKLVPSGVAATIAQRSFGPLLCARVAGAVDAGKALDVAKRLPPGFLADVTVDLDPRRVAAIIAEVPEDLVIPVAAELGRRGEHVTMGRFLAYVPDHAITGAMGVLSDEAMLHTAFVLEHKERLDHAVGLLPPERLPGILQRASELGLWPEALDLLDHLSEERRGPIADVVAAQDEAVITDLIGAVAAADIWDSLLPVVRTMSEESRLRLAATPVFHQAAIIHAIIAAAARQGLWVDLVPLLDALPADVHPTVVQVAASLDAELLERVVAEAANAPHTFPTLLRLVDLMDDADRDRIADLVAAQDASVIADLVGAVARHPETLETLLGIVGGMDEAGRRQVAAAIDDADREAAEILVAAISDPAERARLLALVPDDVMEAIRRAAERFGMRDLLR